MERKNKMNKRKSSIRRFFHCQDCHGEDMWLNIFRISYIYGKEVCMSDGRRIALTADEADELVKLVGLPEAETSQETEVQ